MQPGQILTSEIKRGSEDGGEGIQADAKGRNKEVDNCEITPVLSDPLLSLSVLIPLLAFPVPRVADIIFSKFR